MRAAHRAFLIPLLLVPCVGAESSTAGRAAARDASVGQGEAPLDEARRLIEEASEDWGGGRHAEAIEKLQQAQRLLADLPTANTERAKALRMLTWNHVRAAQAPQATAVLVELAGLAHGDEELFGEVRSAYSGMYELADGLPEYDAGNLLLKNCHGIFVEAGYPRLAAWTLHDRAILAAKNDRSDEMVKLYLQAIRERDRIGDQLGSAWSRANLAHEMLRLNRDGDARDPLAEAVAQVHERRVIEPQAAIAKTLESQLEAVRAEEQPERDTIQWLWGLAETVAHSDVPEIVPAARLMGAALMADVRRRPKNGSKGARRLRKLIPDDAYPELRADMELHAAAGFVQAGATKDALRLIEDCATGAGPAGGHLEARRQRLGALAHAAGKDKKGFEKWSKAASKAYQDIGHRAESIAALEDLVAAGEAISADVDPLREQLESLRRQGAPGGRGGSAQSRNASDRIGELGLHDPVFEVRWQDGAIVMHDLLAEESIVVPVDWTENISGLNGLSLAFFGGYVRLRSLNYGGAATGGGSSSATTLEDMGNYWPVPENGRLVFLKNGAVDYRAGR